MSIRACNSVQWSYQILCEGTLFISHGFHGPPFTLHLNVEGTSALKRSLILQLSKTSADVVTCGGGGGGEGDAVCDGRMLNRPRFNVFFICRLLLSRAVNRILCLPSLKSMYVCPETPAGHE